MRNMVEAGTVRDLAETELENSTTEPLESWVQGAVVIGTCLRTFGL